MMKGILIQALFLALALAASGCKTREPQPVPVEPKKGRLPPQKK
jgi:hypothetical protein